VTVIYIQATCTHTFHDEFKGVKIEFDFIERLIQYKMIFL